ncbi:MAG: T9SS type A sorting domain-containing protein [Williamsia sp.]|nr:T9SS type A sorting domain-containing protein [Williamsia sp.]
MSRIYYLLFFFLTLLAAHSQAQQSGSGVTAAAYAENGITVASQLSGAAGVTVDSAGNVYVANSGNGQIVKWASGATSGTVLITAGNRGSPNGLWSVTGLALDRAANLYIGDSYWHAIEVLTPGSTRAYTMGGGPSSSYSPTDLFLTPSNVLYVVDRDSASILIWPVGASQPSGSIRVVDFFNADYLTDPTGVFVDRSGSLYVAEGSKNRMIKFGTFPIFIIGGKGAGSASNQLNSPRDVVVDRAGNVYVSDAANNRIQRFAPGSLEGVTIAGGHGAGSAANQLNNPGQMFIDSADNIYVCDVNNGRVQKFLKQVSSCPDNIVISATSCNSKVTVQWTEPRDTFPATISIPSYLDPGEGVLTFRGSLGGHGYYRSEKNYLWPVAKDISHYIGPKGVNGHLVTITSEEENNFILNNKGTGVEPWIGLYSPDKNSVFRWVTGEAVTYTKWTAGEPNNYGGNQGTIVEPYGQLYNSGTWNDQRSGSFPFITEFDEPLVRYRQLSGSANGSMQSPGVYMICYERTNTITDQRDTCCFSVTVTCPSASTSVMIQSAPISGKENGFATDMANGELKTIVYPNPSSNQFTVNIRGGNKERVSLQITDIAGKVIETREGLMSNQNLQLGEHLKAGVYIVKVKQGAKITELKIVKQPH